MTKSQALTELMVQMVAAVLSETHNSHYIAFLNSKAGSWTGTEK